MSNTGKNNYSPDHLGHNQNTRTEIVANNLCIGCGICAAICPNQNLRIEFNQYGEYVATERGTKCPDACDMCLKVCPFYDNGENEDTLGETLFSGIRGMKHRPETGYYLDSFVGYSNQNGHRENGASGGLATWTLEKLLTDDLVDHLGSVSPNDDPEKLFRFKICNTPEEVRECSRSCYYPVELSEIVRYVLLNEGRYAIIALPCVCKAIRLGMGINPKLRSRIRFILGLTCGQTKTKSFAEYICALGGGDPHCLKQVRFRIKDRNRPASEYGMKFFCARRARPTSEGVVYWSEGMNRAWSDRYFSPNACNFCDDVFAECSDVCFMDAWLPEYSSDWRGHNIVLVRSKILCDLLRGSAEKGSLSLKKLDISEVVRSQRPVMVSKRSDLKYRVELAEKSAQSLPMKRVNLCRPTFQFGRKGVVKTMWLLSRKSNQAWLHSHKNVKSFDAEIKKLSARLDKARRTCSLFRIPNAILRELGTVLK